MTNRSLILAIAGGLTGLSACGGGDSSETSTVTAASATSTESSTVTAASARGGYTSAPVITAQPASTSAAAGSAASFSVSAYGAATLTYQWRKDGTAIAGATAATYTISSTTTASAGSYDVVVTNAKGTATSTAATLTVTSTSSACDTTQINAVLSAVSTLKSALGTTLSAAAQYDTSAYSTAQLSTYRTDWSNLPQTSYSRPGITLGQLTTSAQISAFNTLVSTALASGGVTDFKGVIAADDYLGYTLNANGYGADLYHVAFVGTPSATGAWTLMLGGHHMAFNINYNAGCTYPTPHHIGVEPRTAFVSNTHTNNSFYPAGTYTVLAAKANAMLAVFSSLSSTLLSNAFLTGQKFSDVLIGPVEGGTGSYAAVAAKFSAVASSSTRGALVSNLSTAQQAQVTAAIQQFTADYDAATAARLLSDYQAGYASTYVAWANTSGTYSASGPDVATDATYMRIDGPRVWIEIVCQNGVIVQSQTHYHMIYRDKTYDYYNQLGS